MNAQSDSPYCKGHDIWGLNKSGKEPVPKLLVDISYSEDLVIITGQ